MIEAIMGFIERGISRVIVGQANRQPDFKVNEIERLYEQGVATIYDLDKNTIVFEKEETENE